MNKYFDKDYFLLVGTVLGFLINFFQPLHRVTIGIYLFCMIILLLQRLNIW